MQVFVKVTMLRVMRVLSNVCDNFSAWLKGLKRKRNMERIQKRVCLILITILSLHPEHRLFMKSVKGNYET